MEWDGIIKKLVTKPLDELLSAENGSSGISVLDNQPVLVDI